MNVTLYAKWVSTIKYVFDPMARTLKIPAGTMVESDNLPEMKIEGEPAFFGLYFDAEY